MLAMMNVNKSDLAFMRSIVFIRSIYVGVVWGDQFITISFDEEHRKVSEMILDSFDYLR